MDRKQALSVQRADQIIQVWRAIVEVQQHFNDIGMRIRSLFVTILLALFAATGFLLDKRLALDFGDVRVQFAVLIPLFGILGTALFYFIDRYWFHRLLVGSVKHAISIEERYKAELPELSLSAEIGKESPFTPRGVTWLAAKLLVRHEKFKSDGKLHSDGKIELFYKSVMVALLCTAIALSVLGGIRLG